MSVVQPVDWLAIAPPLIVALLAIALLVADLAVPGRREALAPGALAGLLAAAVPVVVVASTGERSTFCLRVSDAPACSYVADRETLVLQGALLAGTAVVALLSARTVERDRLPAGEYWFLLLSSASGALALVAARDLLTLVVALEVVSLPAFALVGIRRHDARSSEAALKIFLVSVVSTALTLYGITLLYGATGQVHLAGLAAAVRDSDGSAVLATGVVLAVAGFAFKVAAVPFHAWAPETYAGAPLPVAAYLSVVSKAAGLVGVVLLLAYGVPGMAGTWAPIVGVAAALTMTVGNVAALRERRAVRLLAWSSIAQSGYMLAPLAAAERDVATAQRATLTYLLAYVVMNLGAFAAVSLVSRSGPAGHLDDYRGLARRDPRTAAALAFALVSLAGLPPGLLGLFAKVVVFAPPVTGGAGWLAVVMAVNVVVGLAYYLGWAARLLADPAAPSGALPSAEERAGARARPWGDGLAVGLTFAAGVVLSLAPGLAVGALG